MTHLRRVCALVGAAALAVTLAPGAAQAEDRPGAAPPAAAGPDRYREDGPRSWAAPDGESVLSPFFAGHVWTGDDAVGSNTAEFEIHTWACGAEDDGVLTSLLTYDAMGFFNGGPGIFMYCSGGEQVYAPVFLDFSFGQMAIDEEVAAGDRVLMTASRTGGVATYTMENVTQGWSAATNGTGDYPNGIVETGDAAMTLGETALEPPVFGRDAVKHVMFDGVALSASDTQKSQMVDADGSIIERATKYRAALPDERFSLINKN